MISWIDGLTFLIGIVVGFIFCSYLVVKGHIFPFRNEKPKRGLLEERSVPTSIITFVTFCVIACLSFAVALRLTNPNLLHIITTIVLPPVILVVAGAVTYKAIVPDEQSEIDYEELRQVFVYMMITNIVITGVFVMFFSLGRIIYRFDTFHSYFSSLTRVASIMCLVGIAICDTILFLIVSEEESIGRTEWMRKIILFSTPFLILTFSILILLRISGIVPL